MNSTQTGLFGKLPAHGDFVMRDLPSGFVNSWDDWLQHYIAGSKEQLAESWLNIYLTSPIWRFVFSAGVIDENYWAGVMLPSVDRVGRYYPLSAVKQLPIDTNPLEFMTMQSDWFSAIENLLLKSLNGEMDIDDLSYEVNAVEVTLNSIYSKNTGTDSTDVGLQVNMEFEEQMPVSVYPYLFDAVLQTSYSSYGVWSTSGSDLVEPCLFLTQGLPQVNGLPAMLDGQWQYWGWRQPFKLQQFETEEQI